MKASPCISICKTDLITGYCYGCGRTKKEKEMWKDENTTEDWKEINLKEIPLDENHYQHLELFFLIPLNLINFNKIEYITSKV